MRTRGFSVAAAAIIVVLGVIAYSNSFTDRFVGMDAKESIRDNPHIRTLWPLSEAMSLPLLARTAAADEGSKGGTTVRRPFLSLSFALNHRLLGPSARGYHAVNLVIHLGAGLFLFGVVRRTLRTPRFTDFDAASANAVALATAAIWVVHPLQTEAVTYLVQRAESLMGLCLLATLYCSIRAIAEPPEENLGEFSSRTTWSVGAIVACFLGMGVKETMVVTPVLVLLYDALFLGDSPPRSVSRSVSDSPALFNSIASTLRNHVGLYAGLAASWTILLILIVTTYDDAMKDFNEGRTIPYLLSQPAVILHYLRLSVWPSPLFLYLNTDQFAFVSGLTSLKSIVGPTLILIALLGATLRGLWLRSRYAFPMAAFFVILAPTSSIVATSDVIQEHRMYLPLAAIIVLGAVGTRKLLGRLPQERIRLLVGALVTSALLIGYAGTTRERNNDYDSEFSMLHPADVQEAYAILTDHTLNFGNVEEAEAAARATLADKTAAPADAAFADFFLGFLAEERRDLALAQTHFERVIAQQPDLAPAYVELGAVLMQRSLPLEAAERFGQAVERRPSDPIAHQELAVALKSLGRNLEAQATFERVLELRPDFAEAHSELAAVLLENGQIDRAAFHYERAVELDPSLASAHFDLARLEQSRGNGAAAALHFKNAALADEEFFEAHREYAIALATAGELDQATVRADHAEALLREQERDGGASASARSELASLREMIEARRQQAAAAAKQAAPPSSP